AHMRRPRETRGHRPWLDSTVARRTPSRWPASPRAAVRWVSKVDRLTVKTAGEAPRMAQAPPMAVDHRPGAGPRGPALRRALSLARHMEHARRSELGTARR